jgi:perosamine synthetase
MRIGRTLPPAAAPVGWRDVGAGLAGLIAGTRSSDRLVSEIREELGVERVFLLSSGKAALTLTLRAMQSLSRERRHVVIPAFTCFSVPAAVLQAGLVPIVCDIDSETFDFDYAQLATLVDQHTLCVVVHHLFGIPAAVDRIEALCRRRGALVLEDAAQALGVRRDSRLLGTAGDAGVFSLGRGKHLTCGGGGFVVARQGPLADAIDRNYRDVARPSLAGELIDLVLLAVMAVFIRPWLYWIPAALPFLHLGETMFPTRIVVRRLGRVQAGALRGWRARLERANRGRAAAARYFGERLRLALPAGPAHPFLRLPLVVRTRAQKQAVCSLAQRSGLGIAAAYPTPVDRIPQLRAVGIQGEFPAARRIAETLITLPTHHFVSDRDRRAIVDLCTRVCAA